MRDPNPQDGCVGDLLTVSDYGPVLRTVCMEVTNLDKSFAFYQNCGFPPTTIEINGEPYPALSNFAHTLVLKQSTTACSVDPSNDALNLLVSGRECGLQFSPREKLWQHRATDPDGRAIRLFKRANDVSELPCGILCWIAQLQRFRKIFVRIDARSKPVTGESWFAEHPSYLGFRGFVTRKNYREEGYLNLLEYLRTLPDPMDDPEDCLDGTHYHFLVMDQDGSHKELFLMSDHLEGLARLVGPPIARLLCL